jgi:signal transduction histidine kinase
MDAEAIVGRLTTHQMLGGAPREELAWLAAHGTVRVLEAGEVLAAKGVRLETMSVILAGHVAMMVDRGAGPRKTREWRGGEVSGVLPYSRVVSPPGDAIAQERTEVLLVPRELLGEMARTCPVLTDALVHEMLDRARDFTTKDLHDDKLMSLGRLSAGLAHELNNPAAALERTAALLESRLEVAERASRALGAAGLTDDQLRAVDAVRTACRAVSPPGVRSPIAQAQREDAIGDWLEDHDLGRDLAEVLADSAVTLEALDEVAAAIQGPALLSALRWAAAGCAVRGLATEIQDAATRIAGLVAAIKGFSHMDQAPASEAVDLARGLANTVAVLKAKARAKQATVTVSVPAGLPRAEGYVGELNQVWANLIDNALDAAPTGGRVDVSAVEEGQGIVVRIVDNGRGIPAEHRERIFEPFYTTKPLGQGTGLGLDIVQRLLRHNFARIEVDSEPGRTEFRVVLPVAAQPGAGR